MDAKFAKLDNGRKITAQSQPQTPVDPVDPATYSQLDEKNARPVELIGGRSVEKEGASLTHAKITTRRVEAFDGHFKYEECEAVASSLRVHVEATEDNFYPDVFVSSYIPKPSHFS